MSHVPVIAVVDDDAAIREAMDDLLDSYGYKCVQFASAEDFLAFERRDGFDCMIVDVKMPGLSGIELQDLLNNVDDSPPIIFVTSYKDEKTRASCMNGGALAVFTKPVEVEQFIERLRSAIGH